jgi:hypothetical protein
MAATKKRPADQPVEPVTVSLADLAAVLPPESLRAAEQVAQQHEADAQRIDAREAASAAHAAAEQDVDLDQYAADHTEDDQRQAAALQAARTALLELFDATTARNSRITATIADLLARGILARYDDGSDDVIDFSNGASRDGRYLYLGGTHRSVLDEHTVCTLALSQALEARLGAHSRPVEAIRFGHGLAAQRHRLAHLIPVVA